MRAAETVKRFRSGKLAESTALKHGANEITAA